MTTEATTSEAGQTVRHSLDRTADHLADLERRRSQAAAPGRAGAVEHGEVAVLLGALGRRVLAALDVLADGAGTAELENGHRIG